MMEFIENCWIELLQLLEELQDEKSFLLNKDLNCENVDNKTLHIKKFQEIKVSLNNLHEKVQDQIVHFNDLKITETTKHNLSKIVKRNQSKSHIEFKAFKSKLNDHFIKDFDKLVCETLKSHITQNTFSVMAKPILIFIENLIDDLNKLIQIATCNFNLMSDVDESFDKVTNLEQSGLVTNLENHSKTQGTIQEPIASTSITDITKKISDKEAVLINNKGLDTKNVRNQMPITELLNAKRKENLDAIMYLSVKVDLKNILNLESHYCKVFETKQSQICSRPSSCTLVDLIINDLMVKSPKNILVQKIDSTKVSVKSNYLEKNVSNPSLKNDSKCNKNKLKKRNLKLSQSQIGVNQFFKSPRLNINIVIETGCMKMVKNFSELALKDKIYLGMQKIGLTNPTNFQKRAIQPCIMGRDIIAQVQSGDGKTVTFSISILQKINTDLNKCQALILVPTCELALKIKKFIVDLGTFLKVVCHSFIGGTSVDDDIQQLETPCHIAVGTPDRVHDLIVRKYLRTNFIKVFVLNKADEMFSRGFKVQINKIFKFLKKDIQVILFAIEWPASVLDVCTHFMRDPVKFDVPIKSPTFIGVKQYYINVSDEEWKFNYLCDTCKEPDSKCVIFCNTSRDVEMLTSRMRLNNLSVSALHEGLDEFRCKLTMSVFYYGRSHFIIVPDLLAHFIDEFARVQTVINYDLPDVKSYINRIKCSNFLGQIRQDVVYINFITAKDEKIKNEIESLTNASMIKMYRV